MISQPLKQTTLTLRGAANMKDGSALRIVDYINALAVRCVQLLPQGRECLQWGARKLLEEYRYLFEFVRHLVLFVSGDFLDRERQSEKCVGGSLSRFLAVSITTAPRRSNTGAEGDE